MTEASDQAGFVNWFRNSSPYIHAHRNRTFVVFFGGEAMDQNIDNLVHDLALLKNLGIRLIIVHGIRPQIDQRLLAQNLQPRYQQNLRITDDQALLFAIEAAGYIRIRLEALLSMGLANSPMAGAEIKVASGNFVVAKPLGVIDGIDYCHTGVVRKINHHAIRKLLDQDNIVLVSPLGYSPSGEVFNLSAEQVATQIAIHLQAEKLILLTEQDCLWPDSNQAIAQMTTHEAQLLIQKHPDLPEATQRSLSAAIKSNQQGVSRVHLVNRQIDGALLLELFSRDGIGSLISATPFEEIRSAALSDIGGILELIKPLEQKGVLVKRSREKLETEIKDYIVIERDGLIIGCTALHFLETESQAEIACLAVHPDYRNADRGNRLLEHLLNKAKFARIKRLFVLTSQTMHWFIERGFAKSDIDSLPEPMKRFYNYKRNSKVLFKDLPEA